MKWLANGATKRVGTIVAVLCMNAAVSLAAGNAVYPSCFADNCSNVPQTALHSLPASGLTLSLAESLAATQNVPPYIWRFCDPDSHVNTHSQRDPTGYVRNGDISTENSGIKSPLTIA